MPAKAVFVFSLSSSFLGSIAQSCTLDIATVFERLEYRADCSFENAGRENLGSGGPSYDLGGGVVYQVMEYGIGHDLFSSWIVADCSKRQYSVVTPQIDTTYGTLCGPNYSHDEVENPNSALRTALGTGGLLAFEDAATEMGLDVGQLDWVRSYGRNGFTAENKSLFSRRVDPFCGCAIWYPETHTTN